MPPVAPLLDSAGDWQDFLSAYPTAGEVESIRKHEGTGRPLGSPAFLGKIEATLSRVLRLVSPGTFCRVPL